MNKQNKQLTPLETLETLGSIDCGHIPSKDKKGLFEILWADEVYKKEFKVIEDALKAFELIKNKKIDVFCLIWDCFEYDNDNYDGLERYNYHMGNIEEGKLTLKEYKFLKRMIYRK